MFATEALSEFISSAYLILMVGVAYAAAFGFLWTPAAAVICACRARARGLSVSRYALFGALCSVLFIVPWIYLVARMYDKSIPRNIVRTVYIILYALWLIGPIVMLSAVVVNELVFWMENANTQRYNLAPYATIFAVSVILAVLNITTWILSLTLLRRQWLSGAQNRFVSALTAILSLTPFRRGWISYTQITLTPNEPVHDGVYLAPWIFLFWWMPISFAGSALIVGAYLVAGHA